MDIYCHSSVVTRCHSSDTSSDNEWYNDWQPLTTSDNEWQQVVQRVTSSATTSDNKWQRMTTNDNEWLFRPIFFFLERNLLIGTL